MAQKWTPYTSLTQAPTNLKEAIDWVLRVTGRDGKKNAPAKPATPPQFGCLCFLAKAVKDLLYDARSPGSPGPSQQRYWDDILLKEELTIAQPVLTDLGLLGGSTSAARDTCAGGTEVIKTLIEQLALGLQKWVGWNDKEDECCLKGDKGIGKVCECPGTGGGGAQCCSPGTSGSGTCQCATNPKQCCYKSAYNKTEALWTDIVNGTPGSTTTTTNDPSKVHLLARIFLGSVCLIWSGLSQLGWLTKDGSGKDRWSDSKLHDISSDLTKAGLGSFMAAMGYDLERLNQGGTGKKGTFINELLTNKDMKWNEFKNGVATKDSVAEYYSSIYDKAKEAGKGTSEKLCEQYPLLVLHILASGYFRAGSAGAKGVTTPAKPAPSAPRKPRTIREILYWLSALPYSQGYRALVDRMHDKYPRKETNPQETVDKIEIHGQDDGDKTDLKKDCVTHYLMAACGYCPLVLIGIQGTIEKEVDKTPGGGGGGGGSGSSSSTTTDDKRCPKHKEDPSSKRCKLEDKDKTQAATAPAAAPAPAGSPGKLKEGQVCYRGYHLEVSKFGPLHGMYANGLFGFQMDISPAQCLDQLRVYVYHCFYQLYFLRKQCMVGVENGSVLGWNSCRYGSGVSGSGAKIWICETKGSSGAGDHTKNCGLQSGAGSTSVSALQGFLCDAIGTMACNQTIGVDLNSRKQSYPDIEEHMNKIVTPSGEVKGPHKEYPELCPVPMGWDKDNHFKDLTQGTHKQAELTTKPPGQQQKYPAHCTGNTISHLLEYYCDPEKCHGTLVVLLRLLACITPTVPRTLGDLFGFYYYIVYIGARQSWNFTAKSVWSKLRDEVENVGLGMVKKGETLVTALDKFSGTTAESNGTNGTLSCLSGCSTGSPYLSPLSGQQYGQLSPLMAGTYLSWLVYLIEKFEKGLEGLKEEFKKVDCRGDGCGRGKAGAVGCGESCKAGSHGMPCSGGGGGGVCQCTSVVSCTGVLPVLYKYGFGYGNVTELHDAGGGEPKKCHDFLETLKGVLGGEQLDSAKKGLHHEINQLIYTTRLPWIFVLTLAWLVAVLYLAFGAIWPLDWTHMRSHCRGWFRKGSLSPWEVLMVGKKKGRGILEFFGGK
ncbi:variant erythrocyte surface antigen-1 beta subunit [Babesia bovis T2Bo]|uniref:variant erythrocyte surface antigen-1 beta subunit n=1 Tax=Babesia bovis T2Bo TaxID=484906 RepID=UPI001C360929|nr:variant erythrocyte surface antigen-1 beta subunit [Babesia bovis T2Bo]EDO07873.2 variant erythrocyte surface antigen-1 beta subunit [Babesia bovis T2Bo]